MLQYMTQLTILSRSFEELAYRIFSLYISSSEIPPEDLQEIVRKSYSPSVFRAPETTPLVTLDEEKQLHLLELFHGRQNLGVTSTQL